MWMNNKRLVSLWFSGSESHNRILLNMREHSEQFKLVGDTCFNERPLLLLRQPVYTDRVKPVAMVTLTLAVSVLSVTMYMKLRLTRSGPLQTQMMRPSRSASLFPAASRDARIFGSFRNKNTPHAQTSAQHVSTGSAHEKTWDVLQYPLQQINAVN